MFVSVSVSARVPRRRAGRLGNKSRNIQFLEELSPKREPLALPSQTTSYLQFIYPVADW
jgi:hypothetical protein